jgi:hypothetical protein
MSGGYLCKYGGVRRRSVEDSKHGNKDNKYFYLFSPVTSLRITPAIEILQFDHPERR